MDGNRPSPKNPTCAVPVPCSDEEMRPLFAYLASGEQADVEVRFPRGTLFADGRLDLCKQSVGPVHTHRLASLLEGHAGVRSLLLGADFIGDEGAGALAGMMRAGKRLDTLFLGCNGISARGVQALLEGARNRPLRALWLKRNPIGDDGAEALAEFLAEDRRLETLDIDQTSIGPRGLRVLADALARHNRTLKRLYLGGNDLGPAQAELLGEVLRRCPLQALYLGPDPLSDDGVARLAAGLKACVTLEEFGARSSAIGPEGAEALADALRGHPSLRRLDLGRAPSANVLARASNRIGDHGVFAIASAIDDRTRLDALLVGGNGIGASGGLALVEAARRCRALTTVHVGKGVPRPLRRALRSATEENAAREGARGVPEAVIQIQSVYRTVRAKHRTEQAKPESIATIDPPTALPVTPGELASATRLLEKLAAAPALFGAFKKELSPLRGAANRLIASLIEQTRGEKKSRTAGSRPRADHAPRGAPTSDQKRLTRAEAREQDRQLAERSLVRVLRNRDVSYPGPPANYAIPRRCYICKAEYKEKHGFYDALCPSCAHFNWERRIRVADLHGHVALITGGRIKIGHQVALKLLRCGASVWITTRFPRDAARRFAAHDDFPRFEGRLRIIGIDLRDLRSVHAFTTRFDEEASHLDILVNNAAITVHKAPQYYGSLLDGESRPLDPCLEGLIHPLTWGMHPLMAAKDVAGALPGSAALVAHSWVPSLGTGAPASDLKDLDGEPLDPRPRNSWSSAIEDVSLAEMLEVQAVTNIAPFILTRGLLPALRRSPNQHRHVVNVSAMEGNFARAFKSGCHPHTNMAKASLNMLTRTIAGDLGIERIYVNSVDTGWVTDEQPLPFRARVREATGFEPPLDTLDGAARVCDPVLGVQLGEMPSFGQFLKDYRPQAW